MVSLAGKKGSKHVRVEDMGKEITAMKKFFLVNLKKGV